MFHIESMEWVKRGRGRPKNTCAQKHDPKPEHFKMRDLYVAGNTLQEIGDIQKPPITRERVRQLIKKHFGITRKDGGKFISTTGKIIAEAIDKKHRIKENKDARTFSMFGCSQDMLEMLNNGKKKYEKGSKSCRYVEQKRNARTRGIVWNMTFPEWCKVWDDSGKWKLRGRGTGYCMTRIGDTGAYESGNVEIKTIGQNFSESYYKHPWKERFKNSHGKKQSKTHCIRGHERNAENINPSGNCRACARINYRLRKRASVK